MSVTVTHLCGHDVVFEMAPHDLPEDASPYRRCHFCEAAIARAGLPQLVVAGLRSFQRNGWPNCPKCGEDEVGNLSPDAPEGDLIGYLRGPLFCYACGWKRGPR